ncbi:hypothetical protein O1611_g9763 [Lasiodiplodia mahajangana]|uniref:Uncharacterized protein n=1 Tax=Lasiodiplodia mahajangana TaxID=1108764 RepID=A0ACC2J5T3_9PEZI|nr:hypothetical protein O1611_g9763 [Lasiodiplodia mahajangana]
MSLPFQCLSPLGSGTLFCAAKGCSIQTFALGANSQPLFSWTHPSLKQAQHATQIKETHEGAEDEEQTGQQPPSKRRKLGSDEAESNVGTEDQQGTPGAPASGEKKNQKKGKAKGTPPKPEAPLVVLLKATEDGAHVVAVTGQDKTLWVFRHDGKGSLEESYAQAPLFRHYYGRRADNPQR